MPRIDIIEINNCTQSRFIPSNNSNEVLGGIEDVTREEVIELIKQYCNGGSMTEEDVIRIINENIPETTPITHEWNGTVLSVTSSSGTSSADLKGDEGKAGSNGLDGYSPTAEVTEADGVTTIVITDANGSKRFTVSDGKDAVIVDPLAGKNILCLGDSLMAGSGWTGGYANCIKENHPDVNIVNIAQGGATLIQNDTGNFIFNQLKAYNDAGRETPDIILFDGGGNDCLYRATIGTGKLDSCYINGWQSTMCDALEYLIYAARTYYPTAKLLYLSSPLMMQWDTEEVPSVPTPDVQLEYLVAREKVLEKWGVPEVDIRREGNVTSCTEGQMSNYYIDSIHLNEAGYRFVAPLIENGLKKLF